MDKTARTLLRIGDWDVDTVSGVAARGNDRVPLEARALALLLRLAEQPGEVVSLDALLASGWPEVIVSPDSVYQAITSLRRQLGDDSRQPRYIATVPRLGYRLIAEVATVPSAIEPASVVAQSTGPERAVPAAPVDNADRRARGIPARLGWLLAVALLVVFGVAAYQLGDREDAEAAVQVPAASRLQTLAVLPFLDLTDAMNEEPFADGMTEELIVRLSQVPGLRVSAPTASFQFKDKQVPVPEIARSLGVAYLLDGSVRKSESTLRVSVRLLRADDGFVVWSDTYDRPHEDKLAMQDEIAGEVTSVLARLAPSNAASP
nr:winged helix-turn-helix domain-containing protein [Pseudoxanthomonas sp.]